VTVRKSQCLSCKWLRIIHRPGKRPLWRCPAYEGEIPREILFNLVMHTQPYKQDDPSILWTPKEKGVS